LPSRILGRKRPYLVGDPELQPPEVIMKAPIASLLAVLCAAPGLFGSASFVGAAHGVEAALTDPPAGACGAAIARLETDFNQARASGHIVVSAPESVDAKLHRQPTSKSIESAQIAAVARIADAITAARKLRVDGKRAQCIFVLQQIASPLGGAR
jgi:hypothetical protein